MLEKIHIFHRIYLKYNKLIYLPTLCITNKLFFRKLYLLSFYSLIFNLKIPSLPYGKEGKFFYLAAINA